MRQRDPAHWDDGWQLEPGDYTLHVGSSVLDIAETTALRVWALQPSRNAGTLRGTHRITESGAFPLDGR